MPICSSVYTMTCSMQLLGRQIHRHATMTHFSPLSMSTVTEVLDKLWRVNRTRGDINNLPDKINLTYSPFFQSPDNTCQSQWVLNANSKELRTCHSLEELCLVTMHADACSSNALRCTWKQTQQAICTYHGMDTSYHIEAAPSCTMNVMYTGDQVHPSVSHGITPTTGLTVNNISEHQVLVVWLQKTSTPGLPELE